MFRKLRVIWFLVIIHCYSQLQEQELKIFTVLKSAMVKLYLHQGRKEKQNQSHYHFNCKIKLTLLLKSIVSNQLNNDYLWPRENRNPSLMQALAFRLPHVHLKEKNCGTVSLRQPKQHFTKVLSLSLRKDKRNG